MNKSNAKYAASSADLVAQFVQDADSTMIAEFCSRFEILVGEKHRAKAEEMAKKLSEEFLSPKEAQKSGSSSVNKDSPSDVTDINDLGITFSAFGTKTGSKQYVIDEMLADGRYTMEEITNASQASMETVKRRIRKLKSQGYEMKESPKGIVKVRQGDSFPIQKEGNKKNVKRKRRRKK